MSDVRKVRLRGDQIEARFGPNDTVTWHIWGRTPRAQEGYDPNIKVEIEIDFGDLMCIGTQAHAMLEKYRELHERYAGYVQEALEGRE